MDTVLQHHPVAHKMEAEAGPLPLGADLRVREPYRRHEITPGELGEDPRVDLVRPLGSTEADPELPLAAGCRFFLTGCGDRRPTQIASMSSVPSLRTSTHVRNASVSGG
jgi:hypothetical protein